MENNGAQYSDTELALAWWETLRKTHLQISGTKDRGYYSDRYFGYNMRMHKWLTPEEITLIWEKFIKK